MSFFKTIAAISILDGHEKNKQDRAAQEHTIKVQNDQIRNLKDEAHDKQVAQQEALRLKEKLRKAEESEKEIESLLSKPMAEIAKKSKNFKKTLQVQEEIFSNLFVESNAFKELVMEYGKALGKTPEQIKEEAENAKQVVTNNQSKHNNNVPTEILANLDAEEKNKKETERVKKEGQDLMRTIWAKD